MCVVYLLFFFIVVIVNLFVLFMCFMFIELKFDRVKLGKDVIVVVLFSVGVKMVSLVDLGIEVMENVVREVLEIVCELRICVNVVVVV